VHFLAPATLTFAISRTLIPFSSHVSFPTQYSHPLYLLITSANPIYFISHCHFFAYFTYYFTIFQWYRCKLLLHQLNICHSCYIWAINISLYWMISWHSFILASLLILLWHFLNFSTAIMQALIDHIIKITCHQRVTHLYHTSWQICCFW